MSSEPNRGSDAPGLFGPDAGRKQNGMQPPGPDAPLAARMRPRSLDEFVGQDRLVGPKGALRELIERDRVPSLILWGPPGCGKTTLAAILAQRTGARFEPFSAVTEGVPR
ncbi:MAG: AAA family ATPase, partial [Gemmatimonadota bacterium]